MGTAGRRRGAPPGQLGWSRPDRPGPGHRGQAARPDSNVLSIDLLSRVAHIPLAQYSCTELWSTLFEGERSVSVSNSVLSARV